MSEPAKPAITTDIDVLREMVRLAENRRTEELEIVNRLNQYSLGLIVFSGAFISLLVTVSFPSYVVLIAGFFLLISIFCSLLSLRPKKVKGGSLVIFEDVDAVKRGERLELKEYFVITADITENAADNIAKRGDEKKVWVIIAALFLAIALLATYTLYVYAKAT